MKLEQHQALEKIAELARSHEIGIEAIRARLEGDERQNSEGPSDRIRSIITYLGAILVFAGLVAAVNLLWPSLGSASRVVISLGSGIIALILAIAANGDRRYQRAALPLFIIAAVTQPAGLFVFLDEYTMGGDTALGAAAVFGVMTMQMLLIFARFGWTRTVFFALAFGSATCAALFEWLDLDGTISLSVIGLSGLLITAALDGTDHRVIAPVCYPVFAAFLAGSAFDWFAGTFPLDALLIGVAAALVVTSVSVRSRTLLTTSVLITLCFLGYYTDEYFAGMLGWPIALIIVGLLMIGLSSYAVRLGRSIGD